MTGTLGDVAVRTYKDPFHPTRHEILSEALHRNSEGVAARFSLGELIAEATRAEADGDLIWETRGSWTGRWLTEQGMERLRATGAAET